MPRYVDVEKLISEMKSLSEQERLEFIGVYDCIKSQPTAEEVVKCKDCKHSREMDKYEKLLYLETCVGCTHHSTSYYSLIMQGDDYCSYGERKEEK